MPPREYVTNRSLVDPEKARMFARTDTTLRRSQPDHRSDHHRPDCWHSTSAT